MPRADDDEVARVPEGVLELAGEVGARGQLVIVAVDAARARG